MSDVRSADFSMAFPGPSDLPTPTPPARILVVDDDTHVSRTLLDVLSQNGFQGTRADSGEAALEMLAKATYDLDTQLEIAGQEGVFATKNGVRNMRRWYTEIPALRAAYPELQVLSCHDEYLLPTMFDVDGLLVGYGNIAPELLVELIEAGKAQDYPRAHAIHERLLPVTKNVYHRGSHMEGTVALKWGLVNRGILDHATVRTPLLPLPDGAEAEIADAFAAANIGKVAVPA